MSFPRLAVPNNSRITYRKNIQTICDTSVALITRELITALRVGPLGRLSGGKAIINTVQENGVPAQIDETLTDETKWLDTGTL